MTKVISVIFIFFVSYILNAQSFNDGYQFKIFKPSKSFIIACSGDFSQIENDSTKISLTKKKHSPKKATILSAVLPGLGQAYNKKYWKIPIVYTGLLGAGMFLHFSRDQMMQRQNALIALNDGDPLTNPSPKYANTSEQQLKADRDYFRANADYSIIALAIFYTLNIIDATVDAHFYNFNIDKPLALHKNRHWYAASYQVLNKPTFGLAYRF